MEEAEIERETKRNGVEKRELRMNYREPVLKNRLAVRLK